MGRATTVFVMTLLCLALLPSAAAASGPTFTPGASGVGDPYYPLDGNGGYDVKHYDLDLRYDPRSDVLSGTATIEARATQNLSRFDLDFVGLRIRSLEIDHRGAAWRRDGQELIVTPHRGIPKGDRFTVEIRYDGIPEALPDGSGFIATDDGLVIVGEPHGAATWFPANDHPTDPAAFTFHITVPKGLDVVANGDLKDQSTRGSWTTFTWDARDPMATYLATFDVAKFRTHAYRDGGIRFYDAVDKDLDDPWAAPRTGRRYAYSEMADSSYKRLMRTINVPAGGATLSFWVDRSTEQEWDFFFVEAHTLDATPDDDWTTLPEASGLITSQNTGFSCPFAGWQAYHPFLAHYQTFVDGDPPSCTSSGTTGDWWAVSGESGGWEQWTVDLGGFANSTIEVSISYASDDIFQTHGVFLDDIRVTPGPGDTSFENDGNPLDGWVIAGPPPGPAVNANDWTLGTVALSPPTYGDNVNESFARLPEMIDFMETQFGPYPWSSGGGTVVDIIGLGFALETQTRPVYAPDFFEFGPDDSVVLHENAHQWFGDSVGIERWKHIWLNEGFASYAEWLWSEHDGGDSAQAIFDFWGEIFPEGDPFWDVVIGDPGAGNEFDFAVYIRGAMTLHTLRQTVGDDDFFRILKRWARLNAGGNVTTDDFIALSESVSGEDLDALFETWLFTPGRPDISAAAARRSAASIDLRHGPAVARSQLERYGKDVLKRLAN